MGNKDLGQFLVSENPTEFRRRATLQVNYFGDKSNGSVSGDGFSNVNKLLKDDSGSGDVPKFFADGSSENNSLRFDLRSSTNSQAMQIPKFVF